MRKETKGNKMAVIMGTIRGKKNYLKAMPDEIIASNYRQQITRDRSTDSSAGGLALLPSYRLHLPLIQI